jgi:hypothetical protein
MRGGFRRAFTHSFGVVRGAWDNGKEVSQLAAVTKRALCTYALAIGMVLLLSSCKVINFRSEKETKFLQLYPDTSMNGNLRLKSYTLPTGSDEMHWISVENISSNIILIPKNYYVYFYQYDDTKREWVEIDNLSIAGDDRETLLYPEDNIEAGQRKFSAFFIQPDSSELNPNIPIRVVLLGEINQNDQSTGKKIGAYIDFKYGGNK